MREINRGAQYKVFAIGGARVLKIPLTAEESREVVTSWSSTPNPLTEEFLLRILRYRDQALASCAIMQRIIASHPEAGQLVGNPVFYGDGVYAQDMAAPLGKVLDNTPRKRAERLLGSYIASNVACWRLGFVEPIFNFSVNNGTDGGDATTLLDFGEITTDYETAAAVVGSSKWLRAYSYNSMADPALQAYYKAVAEEQLTIESLAAAWPSTQP